MTPPANSLLSARLPTLDGIRGLAIGLVLCHNLQLLDDPHGPLARLFEMGLDRGWVGVQLFFVLSGFLITGILLDTQSAPNHFRSFFARRALRIFPVYYLTLLVVLVLLPLLGVTHNIPPPGVQSQLPFWLYYANWTAPFGPPQFTLSHVWSLAVEEQFYWLWPLVLYRLSVRQALIACVGVAVAALAIRLGMVAAHVNPEAMYKFSFCRMDALTLGGAAAAAMRLPGAAQWLARWRGAVLAVAGLLLLAGLVVTRGYGRVSPMTQGVGYSVLALVFCLLVALAADADVRRDHWLARALRMAPLRTLGKYSYGMYLFHWPLHELLGLRVLESLGIQRSGSVVQTLVYVGACGSVALLLAMLSYHVFESRFLRLKGLFEAAPAAPVGRLSAS
jgi:peptidoglycan/LPS O-acetylase OafA/YrhL